MKVRNLFLHGRASAWFDLIANRNSFKNEMQEKVYLRLFFAISI
jgi:hypothetical protein